jgi:hypothetical protein
MIEESRASGAARRELEKQESHPGRGDTRRLERSASRHAGWIATSCGIGKDEQASHFGVNAQPFERRNHPVKKSNWNYYLTSGQQESGAFSAARLARASEHRRIVWVRRFDRPTSARQRRFDGAGFCFAAGSRSQLGHPLSREFLDFLRTEFKKDGSNTQTRIVLP